MLIEGIVGLFAGKRGRTNPGAIGTSELSMAALIQEAGGRYTELAWNGLVYTVSSGLIATPAAGPLAAGGTPLLALYNPANSGFIAVLLHIQAVWTALGTTSGKGFELDAGPTAPITQATIQRGVANLVGASDDNDMQGFAGVALTASTALKRLRWLNAIGNGTAAAFMGQGDSEEIGGAVIVQPGSVVAVTAAALGVANEAVASIEYAKIKAT